MPWVRAALPSVQRASVLRSALRVPCLGCADRARALRRLHERGRHVPHRTAPVARCAPRAAPPCGRLRKPKGHRRSAPIDLRRRTHPLGSVGVRVHCTALHCTALHCRRSVRRPPQRVALRRRAADAGACARARTRCARVQACVRACACVRMRACVRGAHGVARRTTGTRRVLTYSGGVRRTGGSAAYHRPPTRGVLRGTLQVRATEHGFCLASLMLDPCAAARRFPPSTAPKPCAPHTTVVPHTTVPY